MLSAVVANGTNRALIFKKTSRQTATHCKKNAGQLLPSPAKSADCLGATNLRNSLSASGTQLLLKNDRSLAG